MAETNYHIPPGQVALPLPPHQDQKHPIIIMMIQQYFLQTDELEKPKRYSHNIKTAAHKTPPLPIGTHPMLEIFLDSEFSVGEFWDASSDWGTQQGI